MLELRAPRPGSAARDLPPPATGRGKECRLHFPATQRRQWANQQLASQAVLLTHQASEPKLARQARSWSSGGSSQPASSIRAEGKSASALIPVPLREAPRMEEEQPLLPLPRDVENLADDPQLHNPLQRSERLSTGWFGVLLEYDGVVVEDTSDLQRKAWLKLAEEEGKPHPPQFALRRSDGMKNEQVIIEVFCWTREPMEVRRLAARKEALLTEMLGDMQPMLVSDVPAFMDGLARNKVPAALTTSAPEARVRPALQALGLEHAFEGVVAAEDTYRGRPDPEPYLLAAQLIGRPPARCIVIGNSNQTVEAARECGMASVVIAGRQPLYELKAADLVVKHLSELRVMNLKQLFRNEDLVAASEPEPEAEEEEDSYEDTSLW